MQSCSVVWSLVKLIYLSVIFDFSAVSMCFKALGNHQRATQRKSCRDKILTKAYCRDYRVGLRYIWTPPGIPFVRTVDILILAFFFLFFASFKSRMSTIQENVIILLFFSCMFRENSKDSKVKWFNSKGTRQLDPGAFTGIPHCSSGASTMS